MNDRIIAACDGASKGNPGPAGWAWVIADGEGRPRPLGGGPAGHRDEQRRGAHRPGAPARRPRTRASRLEVRMDSQYAMKAVTTWLPGWKRNGWKTSAGKPVANQELVTRIDALLDGRAVEFRYVPAHQVDGDRLNASPTRPRARPPSSQQAAGSATTGPRTAASPIRPPARRRARPECGTEASSDGARLRTLRAKFPGRCRLRQVLRGERHDREEPEGLGPPGMPDGRRLSGSDVAQTSRLERLVRVPHRVASASTSISPRPSSARESMSVMSGPSKLLGGSRRTRRPGHEVRPRVSATARGGAASGRGSRGSRGNRARPTSRPWAASEPAPGPGRGSTRRSAPRRRSAGVCSGPAGPRCAARRS